MGHMGHMDHTDHIAHIAHIALTTHIQVLFNMESFIKDNEITVIVCQDFYTKSIVLKTIYWYSDAFQIECTSKENKFIITMKSVDAKSKSELEDYLLKFTRDLIDFELRQVVRDETSLIQQLLVAKAFSNEQFIDAPETEVSDPLGFDVSK